MRKNFHSDPKITKECYHEALFGEREEYLPTHLAIDCNP